MTAITEFDSLELLWLILDTKHKLPTSIRELLITTLSDYEVDYIISLSRAELLSEVRTYGLLTKIEELSDFNLIQECWDRDLPTDNTFHLAIQNSLSSIEYLQLLETYQQSKPTY